MAKEQDINKILPPVYRTKTRDSLASGVDIWTRLVSMIIWTDTRGRKQNIYNQNDFDNVRTAWDGKDSKLRAAIGLIMCAW
jgi:hypothetical protein